MIHKSLGQLAKRLRRAETHDQLYSIELDCGWHNCAVGTRLRELGMSLPEDFAWTVVSNIVKPEIVQKGQKFNVNILDGKIDKALEFIKELKTLSMYEILKN